LALRLLVRRPATYSTRSKKNGEKKKALERKGKKRRVKKKCAARGKVRFTLSTRLGFLVPGTLHFRVGKTNKREPNCQNGPVRRKFKTKIATKGRSRKEPFPKKRRETRERRTKAARKKNLIPTEKSENRGRGL